MEGVRTCVAPGEPHLERVGGPLRVGVVLRVKLPLPLHLRLGALVGSELAQAIGGGPRRVRLRHVSRLCPELPVFRRGVAVERGLETRAALVEGERLPECPDGRVRAGEGEGVWDHAD